MATTLDLTGTDHLIVRLNGKIVAECCVGTAQNRDDMEAEVRRARALRSLARTVQRLPDEVRRVGDLGDHINTTKAARQQAFARGLLDGIEGKTVPYPGELSGIVPPIKPEHTRSYEAGYGIGEAIARAARVATEGLNQPEE